MILINLQLDHHFLHCQSRWFFPTKHICSYLYAYGVGLRIGISLRRSRELLELISCNVRQYYSRRPGSGSFAVLKGEALDVVQTASLMIMMMMMTMMMMMDLSNRVLDYILVSDLRAIKKYKEKRRVYRNRHSHVFNQGSSHMSTEWSSCGKATLIL